MSGQMKIIFWDVQHGNATYIQSPNGKNIVIDLGVGDYSGGDEKFSPLLYLKNVLGVTQIDHCIITHPHKDHIDDILNLKLFNIIALTRPMYIPDDVLLRGVTITDLPKFQEYLRLHKRYVHSLDQSINPYIPDNFGGMRINTYAPINCSPSNLNNQSIVTVIEFAGTKIVIPGDNENASWNELLENRSFIERINNADVYLASHHGRESGYKEEIIKLIKPKITLISDGSYHENSYRDEYAKKSSGWDIFDNGQQSPRKTLSTYNDGEIFINLGYDIKKERFLRIDV